MKVLIVLLMALPALGQRHPAPGWIEVADNPAYYDTRTLYRGDTFHNLMDTAIYDPSPFTGWDGYRLWINTIPGEPVRCNGDDMRGQQVCVGIHSYAGMFLLPSYLESPI
jgi:hypothetical protein